MAKRRKSVKKTRSKTVGATFSASRLREDVDTYTEGIYALMALINHARWRDADRAYDAQVKFGVGRRMRVPDADPQELTPDCVVQVSETLGVVAEAKPGVSRNASGWTANLEQLLKYNTELHGWWTSDGRIASHDIVALVPISRAIDFKDLVEQRISKGDAVFTRPFAIVAFFKQTGAEKLFVTLKTEHGNVTDGQLNDRLRRSVPVDWMLLIKNYRDPKFMDFEPRLEYTLWVLWELVFSQMAFGQEPENGTKAIALSIDLAQLTQRIQDFYGFRSDGPLSIEIPRRGWLRRALDALVVFGFAKRRGEDQYRVEYRRLKAKDVLVRFGELCFKHREAIARREAPKPLLALSESAT